MPSRGYFAPNNNTAYASGGGSAPSSANVAAGVMTSSNNISAAVFQQQQQQQFGVVGSSSATAAVAPSTHFHVPTPSTRLTLRSVLLIVMDDVDGPIIASQQPDTNFIQKKVFFENFQPFLIPKSDLTKRLQWLHVPSMNTLLLYLPDEVKDKRYDRFILRFSIALAFETCHNFCFLKPSFIEKALNPYIVAIHSIAEELREVETRHGYIAWALNEKRWRTGGGGGGGGHAISSAPPTSSATAKKEQQQQQHGSQNQTHSAPFLGGVLDLGGGGTPAPAAAGNRVTSPLGDDAASAQQRSAMAGGGGGGAGGSGVGGGLTGFSVPDLERSNTSMLLSPTTHTPSIAGGSTALGAGGLGGVDSSSATAAAGGASEEGGASTTAVTSLNDTVTAASLAHMAMSNDGSSSPPLLLSGGGGGAFSSGSSGFMNSSVTTAAGGLGGTAAALGGLPTVTSTTSSAGASVRFAATTGGLGINSGGGLLTGIGAAGGINGHKDGAFSQSVMSANGITDYFSTARHYTNSSLTSSSHHNNHNHNNNHHRIRDALVVARAEAATEEDGNPIVWTRLEPLLAMIYDCLKGYSSVVAISRSHHFHIRPVPQHQGVAALSMRHIPFPIAVLSPADVTDITLADVYSMIDGVRSVRRVGKSLGLDIQTTLEAVEYLVFSKYVKVVAPVTPQSCYVVTNHFMTSVLANPLHEARLGFVSFLAARQLLDGKGPYGKERETRRMKQQQAEQQQQQQQRSLAEGGGGGSKGGQKKSGAEVPPPPMSPLFLPEKAVAEATDASGAPSNGRPPVSPPSPLTTGAGGLVAAAGNPHVALDPADVVTQSAALLRFVSSFQYRTVASVQGLMSGGVRGGGGGGNANSNRGGFASSSPFPFEGLFGSWCDRAVRAAVEYALLLDWLEHVGWAASPMATKANPTGGDATLSLRSGGDPSYNQQQQHDLLTGLGGGGGGGINSAVGQQQQQQQQQLSSSHRFSAMMLDAAGDGGGGWGGIFSTSSLDDAGGMFGMMMMDGGAAGGADGGGFLESQIRHHHFHNVGGSVPMTPNANSYLQSSSYRSTPNMFFHQIGNQYSFTNNGGNSSSAATTALSTPRMMPFPLPQHPYPLQIHQPVVTNPNHNAARAVVPAGGGGGRPSLPTPAAGGGTGGNAAAATSPAVAAEGSAAAAPPITHVDT